MGREDDLVTIARFNRLGPAETARNALAAAGIESHLADQHSLTHYRPGLASRLQVRRADAEAARLVLGSLPEVLPGLADEEEEE